MKGGRIVVEAGPELKTKFKNKCTKLNSDMTKQILALMEKFVKKGKK